MLGKTRVVLDSHRRAVVQEVIDVLLHVTVRSRFVLFFQASLYSVEVRTLGPVEFRLREAEFLYAGVFFKQCFQGAFHAFGAFGQGDGGKGIEVAQEATVVAAAKQERRIGLPGEFLHPGPEHGVEESVSKFGADVS